MFGRNPKLPLDHMFNIPDEDISEPYSEFYGKLKESIHYCQGIAGRNSQRMSEREKVYYDSSLRGSAIELCDNVLVRNVGLKGWHKLQDKWESDTYAVVEKSNDSLPVYKVRPVNCKGPIKNLHRNMLFPLGRQESKEARGRRTKQQRKKDHKDTIDILIEDSEDVQFEPNGWNVKGKPCVQQRQDSDRNGSPDESSDEKSANRGNPNRVITPSSDAKRISQITTSNTAIYNWRLESEPETTDSI